MTISNLNVFQSGTVASVTPMNENFETVRVAVNTVEQSVTTNRTYLDNKITEINQSIATTLKSAKTDGEIFCVNQGNFDSNKNPEILTVSGTTLSFSTPFTATNVKGTIVEVTSISSISLSGYSDGTYNVFVDTSGAVEILANTIYKQATEPTNTVNDIWLNTSKIPLEAKKYTSDGWVDFLKIPVGRFVVSSGSVTTVKTNSYNQNGYSLNTESDFPLPNFSKGVSKTKNVSYTAETSGWLYVYYYGESSDGNATLVLNGTNIRIFTSKLLNTYAGYGTSFCLPLPKNTTYSITAGSNPSVTIVFYPATKF